MYVRMLLLSLAAGLAAGLVPLKLNKFNMMKTYCWGQGTMMKYFKKVGEITDECNQLEPPFDIPLFDGDYGDLLDDSDVNPFITSNQGFQTLPSQVGRGRRQADGLLEVTARQRRATAPPTAEEFEEFKGKVADFKQDAKDKIGNLTCVMSKMGMLDKNLGVNLQYFTVDFWNLMDPSEPPKPEWKTIMVEGYEKCYKKAQSIPQDVLAATSPLFEMLGRQMDFFKCAKKVETTNCERAIYNDMLIMLYGEMSFGDIEMSAAKGKECGLPMEKYERVAVSVKTKQNAATPQEEFVSNFFWGDGQMIPMI